MGKMLASIEKMVTDFERKHDMDSYLHKLRSFKAQTQQQQKMLTEKDEGFSQLFGMATEEIEIGVEGSGRKVKAHKDDIVSRVFEVMMFCESVQAFLSRLAPMEETFLLEHTQLVQTNLDKERLSKDLKHAQREGAVNVVRARMRQWKFMSDLTAERQKLITAEDRIENLQKELSSEHKKFIATDRDLSNYKRLESEWHTTKDELLGANKVLSTDLDESRMKENTLMQEHRKEMHEVQILLEQAKSEYSVELSQIESENTSLREQLAALQETVEDYEKRLQMLGRAFWTETKDDDDASTKGDAPSSAEGAPARTPRTRTRSGVVAGANRRMSASFESTTSASPIAKGLDQM